MRVQINLHTYNFEAQIEVNEPVRMGYLDAKGVAGSASNLAVAINRALAAVFSEYDPDEKAKFLEVFNRKLRDRPSTQTYYKYIDATGKKVQDRGLGMWAMQLREDGWQFGTAEQIGVAFPVTPDPERATQ